MNGNLSPFNPWEISQLGLTSYSGGASDISTEDLQKYISLVENGKLKVSLGKVFNFDDLVEAHKLMDANLANGKIVVRVP